MSEPAKPMTRPISPHLQVYRLPMTALMSISHRITGAILAGGCVLIALFLVAAVMGQNYFDMVMVYARGPYGHMFFLAWAFVFYYHLCSGIRHLIWDTACLLDMKKAVASGWLILLATAGLTAATCYLSGQ